MSTAHGWQFWIDRGGTFTDIVARRPDGRILTRKLLSDWPERYRDAAVHGVRELLSSDGDGLAPPGVIDEVKIGTTLGTNALLEHRGAPTVLVITRGFGDLLQIGHQTRPKIFARRIDLPPPHWGRVIEAVERVTADGELLTPLDDEALGRALAQARADGFTAAAIVFLHAYAFPAHERRAVQVARAAGFRHVSASHEVSPLIKVVDRGHTTVADACLAPLLGEYAATLEAELAGARLLYMQSNGGLVPSTAWRGRNCILSGPAAGVVGAARTATAAGFTDIIGFDMGGTSTDVSHYAGDLERAAETEIGGRRLQAPAVLVHTVAAGGGSVLHFDGGRYRVGPDSAGAVPGPTCYRRGGPLTITDCNVMVGKVRPEYFPSTFGATGDQGIDAEDVQRQFRDLAATIHAASGDRRSPVEVAHGFLEVAVANMAAAIRTISIQRGYDPSTHTLACFGGAGPQHACLVADALGMSRVLVHRHAGVLSAYGVGLADERVIRERGVERDLTPALADTLGGVLDALADGAEVALRQADEGRAIRTVRRVRLRYAGSDTALDVAAAPVDQMRREFETTHQRRFGFAFPTRGLVVSAVWVEAIATSPVAIAAEPADHARLARPDALATVRLYTVNADGDDPGEVEAPVYPRDALSPGASIDGPALLVEPHSTLVVEPGWRALRRSEDYWLVERVVPRTPRRAEGTSVDPVRLEVLGGLFMAAADRMGTTLEETAQSVNIRERRDFSCAVFDPAGGLVANAPHIPVHLGSMGDSVLAVIDRHGASMQTGDAFLVNSPYAGGTHLPDLTVVSPVFDTADAQVLFYVASRGHHADVGGMTPGSMPPDSRHIDDEGILFDGLRIVRGSVFLEREIREHLGRGPYPARNIAQNLADLEAQLAANQTGARALLEMLDQYGAATVQAYMGHVQDHAEAMVQSRIRSLSDGQFQCALDSGQIVAVRVTIDRAQGAARIDFTGTSPQADGNINAPLAVCKAAVLYVFRLLLDADIPLNGGCLRPLDLVVPPGTILNPRWPAAVVAGNVETSQAVVDALLGALGVMAASQGTMNNLTFGDDRWQYYETICGGAGAGPDFDGASAVHTHMTNSRITDPEVLESRFPVLLDAFAVRRGSGGAGLHRGGDGVVRRLRFRAPLSAAIISNRRLVAPFGLAGGQPGARGANRLERADGRVETLAPSARTAVEVGDVLVIETPGGGGYGAAEGMSR
jgi:5-oxoprolinase (ATP-hydrolysing)